MAVRRIRVIGTEQEVRNVLSLLPSAKSDRQLIGLEILPGGPDYPIEGTPIFHALRSVNPLKLEHIKLLNACAALMPRMLYGVTDAQFNPIDDMLSTRIAHMGPHTFTNYGDFPMATMMDLYNTKQVPDLNNVLRRLLEGTAIPSYQGEEGYKAFIDVLVYARDILYKNDRNGWSLTENCSLLINDMECAIDILHRDHIDPLHTSGDRSLSIRELLQKHIAYEICINLLKELL